MDNGVSVSYENGTKKKLENVSAAVTCEFLSRVLEERSYKPLADKMAKKMLEELVCDPIDRKRVKDAAVLLQKLTEAFSDAGIENMTQQCERLDVHHANARQKYSTTVQHLFSDGITWGRVTLFYSFSIGFALHVADRQMDELVNSVQTWSVQVMNNKVNPWIHANGGWVSATLLVCASIVLCVVVNLIRYLITARNMFSTCGPCGWASVGWYLTVCV